MLDLSFVRGSFPALSSEEIFFDGPGGTQIPRSVIDRTVDYLINTNANRGGLFRTSQASDAIIQETRKALADFLNAQRPEEIILGPNMTTLTLSVSRSLAHALRPGDELVVTRLDHDANIMPWLHIAEEHGCTVHWIDFDMEDCTLNLDQYTSVLSKRTRVVAVGYASNSVGTVNPVGHIAEQAHRVGALCFVDAVQYAPHGPIDVQALDCDFLVVSAYKFFGPHLGVLYGKYEQLERLHSYKMRPSSPVPPDRIESGTQDHEGIAGTLGVLEYFERLGREFGTEHAGEFATALSGRRLHLKQALAAIRDYESRLCESLIEQLLTLPGLRIYGITDASGLDYRVPVVSFRVEGYHPRHIAGSLGQAGIHAWAGNFYAPAITERLGLEDKGGLVRVGLSHYNSLKEVEKLRDTLERILRI